MEWHDILLRLVAAAVLPAAIGWDREARGKSAGLRTHMLVGLGSGAFVLIALAMLDRPPTGESAVVTLDPIRILDGLIGGVGFLGAGVIIQSRGQVEGVTTAAGIWTSAAIGGACGAGHLVIGVMITALAAIVVLAMIPLKVHLAERGEHATLVPEQFEDEDDDREGSR